MEKVLSLAEYLGTKPDSVDDERSPSSLFEAAEKLTATEFCDAVLNSYEFRQYIVNGLTLGTLSAAIIGRIMDQSWGKPLERHEHTGKDGQPIVTEVRRVVVRVQEQQPQQDKQQSSKPSIH